MLNLNAGLIMTTCFLFAQLPSGDARDDEYGGGHALPRDLRAVAFSGYSAFGWLSGRRDPDFQRRRDALQPEVQRVHRQLRARRQEGDVPRLLAGADPDRLDHSKESSARSSITSSPPKTCLPANCSSTAACRPRKLPNTPCPSARRSTDWCSSLTRAPEHLTQVLYQTHQVGLTWYVFAAIGVASAVMIFAYGKWIQRLAQREAPNRGE